MLLLYQNEAMVKTCRRRVFEFLNSYSEAFTYMQLNLMKKYNNYHHEYEEKKN